MATTNTRALTPTTFGGAMPDKEVWQFLSQIDVLPMPSRSTPTHPDNAPQPKHLGSTNPGTQFAKRRWPPRTEVHALFACVAETRLGKSSRHAHGQVPAPLGGWRSCATIAAVLNACGCRPKTRRWRLLALTSVLLVWTMMLHTATPILAVLQLAARPAATKPNKGGNHSPFYSPCARAWWKTQRCGRHHLLGHATESHHPWRACRALRCHDASMGPRHSARAKWHLRTTTARRAQRQHRASRAERSVKSAERMSRRGCVAPSSAATRMSWLRMCWIGFAAGVLPPPPPDLRAWARRAGAPPIMEKRPPGKEG